MGVLHPQPYFARCFQPPARTTWAMKEKKLTWASVCNANDSEHNKLVNGMNTVQENVNSAFLSIKAKTWFLLLRRSVLLNQTIINRAFLFVKAKPWFNLLRRIIMSTVKTKLLLIVHCPSWRKDLIPFAEEEKLKQNNCYPCILSIKEKNMLPFAENEKITTKSTRQADQESVVQEYWHDGS